MLCSQCGTPIDMSGPEKPTSCSVCGFALVEVIEPSGVVNGPGQPATATDSTLTGRQTYNIVSDLATGVNVRKRDNLYQALFILASIPAGALVGVCISRSGEGICLGCFGGLLAGLFGSGIFLMVYRALRHAQGRHD